MVVRNNKGNRGGRGSDHRGEFRIVHGLSQLEVNLHGWKSARLEDDPSNTSTEGRGLSIRVCGNSGDADV